MVCAKNPVGLVTKVSQKGCLQMEKIMQNDIILMG